MITIKVDQKPFYTELAINRAYELHSTIELAEDCNITEALASFVEALKMEGYRVTKTSYENAIEELVADGILEDDTLE